MEFFDRIFLLTFHVGISLSRNSLENLNLISVLILTMTDSSSLASGWRIKTSGGGSFIVSPKNRHYKSRAMAVIEMIKKDCGGDQLDEMRSTLHHEGWRQSELLPDKWYFKVWEGRHKNKDELMRKWSFLTREGLRLESFKVTMSFMKQSKEYTSEDIVKLMKLKKLETNDLRKKKYQWRADEKSLPDGWLKRPSTNKEGAETFISPDGTQFRSRVSAIKYLSREGSLDDIEKMKEKLLKDGWQTSDLMPDGWIYKKIWEGKNSLGKLIHTYHYIADDGKMFEGGNTALEYLQAHSVDYSKQEVENFQKFLDKLYEKTLMSYQWLPSSTVPDGWKIRVIGTGREYLLSPEGRTFHTRFSAYQHMVGEKYSEEEVMLIRGTLGHEGWLEDSCLPKGWLYKLLQGRIYKTGKIWKSYRFISREHMVLESIKSAILFMKEHNYSRVITKRCKRFWRNQNRNRNSKIIVWNDSDDEIPYGWKSRIKEDGSKMLQLPNKQQYSSLFHAFKHMVNNGYMLSQVNVVKSYLHFEGWQQDQVNLPKDWLVKKMSFNCYWFIGKYGEFLEDSHKALDYIESMDEYEDFDKENFEKVYICQNNNDHTEDNREDGKATNQKVMKIKLKLDWLTHPALPQGWKARKVIDTRGSGLSTEAELFLSPEGVTISGRRQCGQFLTDHGYPESDVEKLWRFSWNSTSLSSQTHINPKQGAVATTTRPEGFSDSDSD